MNEERNVLFVSYLFEKFPDVEPSSLQRVTSAPTSAHPSPGQASSGAGGSPSGSAPGSGGSPGTPLTRTRSGTGAQRDTLRQLIEENSGEKREERGIFLYHYFSILRAYLYCSNESVDKQSRFANLRKKSRNGAWRWIINFASMFPQIIIFIYLYLH